MQSPTKPFELGVYGYSGSGKSTLILRLIADLKQSGKQVGVIKKTDKNIRSEPDGKDTVAFRIAGAVLTVFSSQIETNFVEIGSMTEYEILRKMEYMKEFDVVIVEGANDPRIPKIRIGSIPERENTIFLYSGNYEELTQVVKNLMKGK